MFSGKKDPCKEYQKKTYEETLSNQGRRALYSRVVTICARRTTFGVGNPLNGVFPPKVTVSMDTSKLQRLKESSGPRFNPPLRVYFEDVILLMCSNDPPRGWALTGEQALRSVESLRLLYKKGDTHKDAFAPFSRTVEQSPKNTRAFAPPPPPQFHTRPLPTTS